MTLVRTMTVTAGRKESVHSLCDSGCLTDADDSDSRDQKAKAVPMNTNPLFSSFILGVTAIAAGAAITSSLAADYQSTVLADQPVGYWRLSEMEGTNIANLGTLGAPAIGGAIGGVLLGQPGAVQSEADTAAFLDGSGRIEIPYAEELNPETFTYEVWANVDPSSFGSHRSPLSSRDDTPVGNTSGVIFYADPAETWQFWNGRGTESWHVLGDAFVTQGLWTHLVGTYDGTNKAFYVDGVLVSAARTSFQPNRARPLRIGAGANENPAGNYFFNGMVDEAAVYSGVLSGDRILAHYTAGSGLEPAPVAPIVIAEPQSTEVFKGEAPSLSVLATGSLPLNYQWKFNETDIPGATSYALVLTNVQPASSGAYRVVVSNAAGEAASLEATLTVADISAPLVTQQPRSRTVLPGLPLTLDVQASGSATFAYQWQFNGADIPNATNATFTLPSVQQADTGAYKVILTNAAGTTTSAEAVVQFPAAATKSYAETVMDDAPVSYWRLDEASGDVADDSAGANPGNYLNGVTFGVPGALVTATNAAAGFSAAAQQKVDVPFSPALNTQEFTAEVWARATGGSGHRSPLTSRAGGPERGYIFYADPADTWQFWTGLGEETGWDTIVGPAVQNGAWVHLVGVYDGAFKSFYVNGVLVGIKEAPYAPNDANPLRIGGGATESDGEFFFEGSVDEVSYYDKALTEDRILAHYVAGFPLSTPPAITAQPGSKLVPAGATVTLTVSAIGGQPLSYQWRLNSAPIAGATNASLVVTNVQAAQAGDYTVVVTNAGGTVTSDVAKLELPAPPTMSYSETIIADGPLAYWRLDETMEEVADDAVGQNDGFYLNGVTLGLPGALTDADGITLTNTAVGFEVGTQQKVDVAYNPELNPELSFSVELWAKVTGNPGAYRSPLTSRGDGPPRGYIFYATPADNWQFWTGNGDVGGWDSLVGPTVVTNEWAYLAGTFDGTTKRFYVNAIEVASSTPAFSPNTENPLRFGAGRTETEGDYFFQGSVDEVAFYNKVLTPEQIVLHFAAGRPPQSQVDPTIGVRREGGNVVVTWTDGALQETTDLNGAWQDVPGAASPLTVTPSGERKFYRVQ